MRRTLSLFFLLAVACTTFTQVYHKQNSISQSLFNGNSDNANEKANLSCNNWLYCPSQPSYFSTLNQINITGNQVTLEAVINRTTPYSGGPIWAGDVISKHYDPTDCNYLLRPNEAEITTSNGYFRTPDVCEIELNKTYHVAMVYDGTTLKFYRNGFLMSQINASGNLVQNNWQTRVGFYETAFWPENFIGYINEVRVWNVARTQAQIRAYMNTSLPSPTTQTGLLAYYTFDNLQNKQGNAAYNGVLGGSASISQTNPNCNLVIDSCAIVPPTTLGCSGSQFAIGGNDYDRAFDVAATTNNEFYVAGVSKSYSTNDDLLIMRVTSAGIIVQGRKIGNVSTESVRKITPTADGGLLITGQTKSFGNPNGDIMCMKLGSSGNLLWSKILGLGSPNGDLGMDIIETSDGGYAVSGIINVVGFLADGVLIKLDNNANVVWAKRYNRGDGEDGVGILQKGDTLVVATDLQNSGSHYEFTLMKVKLSDGSFIMAKKYTPTVRGLFNPYIFKNPVQPGYLISGHTIDYDVYTNMNHTVIAVDDNFNFLHSALVSLPVYTNDFYTGFAPLADGSWIGCATPQTNADAYVYRIRSDNTVYYSKRVNAATDRRFYRLAVSGNQAMAVGGAGSGTQEDFYLNSFYVNGLSDSSCDVENVSTTIQQPTYSVNSFTWPTYNSVSFPNISSTLAEAVTTFARTNLCPGCVDTSVIINAYTPVLGYNSCNNNLTVEDASSFNIGDTVLLIQMKGAVIDSTNTSNFGNVLDYKNAGNYEFNYVKSKTGNNIELKNKLTRQYDVPNGKVQLVRVPYFQNVTVNSNLTCLPWDGKMGGVLVFNVADSITLNANIDVSGKGFKRGNSPNTVNNNWACNSPNYYYAIGSVEGAAKGEGITQISSSKAYGKGRLANGGGGGNQSNAGGGGGGNAGSGGFGGNQFAYCPTSFDNRGIGGVSPSVINQNKIFLGGGGGAGDANNPPPPASFSSFGGNGGGIIIITANKLTTTNLFKIRTNGDPGLDCNTGNCHEGMGGGGAGGSVLLNINNYVGAQALSVEVNGGKGADAIHIQSASPYQHGPGGGGGGGVVWFKNSTAPSNVTVTKNGGVSGVNVNFSNDPWGATAGQNGQTLTNLVVPFDTVLFTPNIDSVKIKDSLIACSNFDFKGLAYVNTNPISTWQWYFGDGGTANTQNTTHNYSASGTYTVKLVVTDINGCKDSTTKIVNALAGTNYDFNFQVNVCNPLTVQFNGVGTSTQNPYWSFGDGGTNSGTLNPVHTYSSQGNYTIKYTVQNACPDTITKTINLSILTADIVLTHDTTICYGTTKQLLTAPSLSFCWNPTTYLNNPNSPNPVTSTPQNITYYFTAQVEGANVITNGNFSQGNTGFTSQYVYANPNVTEGQYSVGTNPQAWNVALSPCPDHTTGSGNMMMVNGSPVPNVNVWTETVPVTPNTNYAFSTWIQALWPPNPAQLKFAINGNQIGTTITATLPTCTWTQFYTTWNSGNNTTATISIVNINTAIQGNDFALDDISFAPVVIKRDSVVIMVDHPVVTTNPDSSFCQGLQLQLTAAGANNYSWSPPTGLSNPNISNPVASPTGTTQYIVTGTTVNGCTAKDTVVLTIIPKPAITTSNDTLICKNTSVQLFASGGINYVWSPAASLNNPNIANPLATPTTNTIYHVTVTNSNNCTNSDSVKVDIRPQPVFTISQPASLCTNDSVRLNATGGNSYSWQPTSSLSNPAVNNPLAFPTTTTTYTVQITETTCNNSSTLSTTITVLPLPFIQANKSGDIDCTTDFVQLTATGGAKYSWSPAASLNNPNIANPVARPVVTTLYSVRGTDANGCVNFDTVTVDITSFNKGEYLMPSAFTPNGDGLNDCYGIKYWGVIDEIDFSIYNRWGERVFHTKKPGECWDGTYKGVKQDSNVFVYLIKAKTSCGEVFRKGTFALIR
jgi:gliding motility-associated-like protein